MCFEMFSIIEKVKKCEIMYCYFLEQENKFQLTDDIF